MGDVPIQLSRPGTRTARPTLREGDDVENHQAGQDEQRHAMSRRKALGIAGAGLAAVAGGAAQIRPAEASASVTEIDRGDPSAAPRWKPEVARTGALGANFNGATENVNFEEIEIAGAGWLRGFGVMSDSGASDPQAERAIRVILDAGQRGYGTILSLKFQFRGSPLPAPGSAAMDAELARLDKTLPRLMGKVDKIVIGNEPFIETRPEDRTPDVLNPFYETIAERVIAHRRQHGGANSATRLYMGALNRLDLPENRTEATKRWLRFVHDTEALAGVDIHPHVRTPEATDAFLEYVVPELADGQEFLVTEFSLLHQWRVHLTDPAVGNFGGRAVWEVIKSAIDERFTQQDWNDFLSAQPWFEQHKHFLRDQLRRFRASDRFGVATYGLWQDEAMATDFNSESDPWLLNSVFAPFTVQPRPDGTSGRGYHWIDDFRALQAH